MSEIFLLIILLFTKEPGVINNSVSLIDNPPGIESMQDIDDLIGDLNIVSSTSRLRKPQVTLRTNFGDEQDIAVLYINLVYNLTGEKGNLVFIGDKVAAEFGSKIIDPLSGDRIWWQNPTDRILFVNLFRR